MFGFMIDMMYVLWVWSVGTGNILLAGVSSMLLALPSLLGMLEIVEKGKKMIVPYLLGLGVGSMVGIYLTHL